MPAPRTGTRFVPLRIAQRRAEADDACSFLLDVPPSLRDDFAFRPGQHLAVRQAVGGKDERRTYSLCGTPGEWRILVRRVEGGLFSNHANDSWEAGTEINVMRPRGAFVLPEDLPPRARILALAAGTGITPVLPMLESALAGRPGTRATLVYGNRATGSIAFGERLADLKDTHMDRFSVFHVLSRERTEHDLLHGRLDEGKCARLFAGAVPPGKHDLVLLCGPEGMMAAARAALQSAGYPPGRVRSETFTVNRSVSAARRPAQTEVAHCRAAIVLNGVRHEIGIGKGQTVLEAALAQGLDPPFSCRGGVCATCRSLLRDGRVEMDTNHALDEAALRQGFILACQSRPRTATLTVDFDVA